MLSLMRRQEDTACLKLVSTKLPKLFSCPASWTVRGPNLQVFFETLREEELTDLVAVMWIGRGSFEPEELAEARATAIAEATVPTPDYLMGTPHLSDHLENGLEALGLSAFDEEDDLIRKG